MSVSRLTANISLERIEKFIIMYGNTADQYCDKDLITGNIDFMLWRYFQRQGFQRIIFIQSTGEVYFLDKESVKLFFPEQSVTNTGIVTPGPLGKLNFLDIFPDYEKKKLNFTGFLNIFEKAMLQETSTLVIFNNAQDLNMGSLGEESYTLMRNRLVSWSLKNIRTFNKCLFIFNSPDKNSLKKSINANGLDFLNSFIKSQEKFADRNVIHVGSPDQDEINNLIHHFRFLKAIRPDWQLLDKIIELLVIQEIDLKVWYSHFHALEAGTALNKEILLKWHDESLFRRASRFIIQNIDNKFFFSVLFQDFSKVYCQDDSTSKIVKALESWYFRKNSKPYYLFFAGPESSGKKYTVRIMSEALAKIGYHFFCYDCQQLSSESERLSELDTAIRADEKVLVLFEQVDKAGEELLSYLTELAERNKQVRKDIFCFTMDIDHTELTDIKNLNKKAYINEEPEFQKDFRDYLSGTGISERLVSRFNLLLIYGPLTEKAVIKIIREELDEIARDYDLQITEIEKEVLLFLYDKTLGNLYRTRTYTNYLETLLGTAFFDFRKTYPDTRDIAIRINDLEIEILPVSFSVYNKKETKNPMDNLFDFY